MRVDITVLSTPASSIMHTAQWIWLSPSTTATVMAALQGFLRYSSVDAVYKIELQEKKKSSGIIYCLANSSAILMRCWQSNSTFFEPIVVCWAMYQQAGAGVGKAPRTWRGRCGFRSHLGQVVLMLSTFISLFPIISTFQLDIAINFPYALSGFTVCCFVWSWQTRNRAPRTHLFILLTGIN